MRVCIVGAGAIGGWIGARLGSRLPAHRVRLSALARGNTLAALRRDGLVLRGSEGVVGVPVHASDDPRELGPQDLIVLAVKAPALAAVAPAVAALMADPTRVLVAMNGVPWWFFDGLGGPCEGLRLRSVDPDGRLKAAIPSHRVIGCVVHASCRVDAPGVIHHVQGDGLVIGQPDGRGSPDLQSTAELLSDAGFKLTVADRIQRDIWFKLWGNLTMNPLSALTGATCDRILDDDAVRDFTSAVMREAGLIGQHIGCPIDQQPEERHAITRKLGAFKTSMLQDREAGRPMEIDAIVGAVQDVARHLGLATPNIDLLAGLARLMVPPAAGR